MAEKFDAHYERRLVRVDVAAGREYAVASQYAMSGAPVAYVRSVDRFLFSLYGYYGDEPSAADDSGGSYAWINPATGAVRLAAGDLRPLAGHNPPPLN